MGMTTLPGKTILHVGLEKAASTTIQNFLESRYDALLAQSVWFPRSVFSRKIPEEPERTSGHLELLRNLADGDITAFQEEAAAVRADRLLLSAENLFHHPNSAHLALLADLLAESEITLVVVLRRQDDWLRSYYTESVTNGWNAETASIDRFAERMMQEGRLDYAALLSRMQAIFSPTHVKVLDYDTLREGRGVVVNFCAAIDLSFSEEDFAAAPRSHVSQTFPEALEAHRRLNLLSSGFWSGQMHEWSRGMRAHAQEIGEGHGALGRPLQPGRAQRQAVYAHAWSPNKSVSQRFLPEGAPPLAIGRDWINGPETVLDEALVEDLWDDGLQAFLALRSRTDVMRAKDHLTHRFPLPLLLRDQEALHLNSAAAQAGVVLTYSAGATALMAAARRGKMVFCVTRKSPWLVDLQRRVDQLDLPSPAMVYISPPGDTNYATGIWREPFFRQPDLVLIDGHARAACLVATALQTRAPVTVLFDDYAANAARLRIENLLLPVRYHGTMAEFRLAPVAETAQRDRLEALLDQVTAEDD